MAGDRIRVFIAGNIYVKRALVRRFLEDDGFEVVGEARNREDMVIAVRRDQPDAVVVDEELIADGPGGGTMGRLRRAAPDSKVVVFTATPGDPSSAPAGADGYLEKGLGLASLTALLKQLFAMPQVPIDQEALDDTEEVAATPLVAAATAAAATLAGDALAGRTADTDDGSVEHRDLVGAGVAAGAGLVLAPDASEDAPPPTGTRSTGGSSRVAAVVAGALLIVWGLGAVIVSGGQDEPIRALDTTDTTDGTVVEDERADETTPLDDAYATLDEMVAAIGTGNYVLATVDAELLMDQRAAAAEAGFALTGLDAAITAQLEPLVEGIPPRVGDTLASILGGLYPRVSADADEPGGGSDVVLGSTVTDAPTDGGPSAPDGPREQPAPQTPVEPEPAPQTPVEPEPDPAPQPGDGRVWGQSHRPEGGPHGEGPGGSGNGPTERQKANHDGGKPPWAGPPD